MTHSWYPPPLNSETWRTGDFWSKTNILDLMIIILIEKLGGQKLFSTIILRVFFVIFFLLLFSFFATTNCIMFYCLGCVAPRKQLAMRSYRVYQKNVPSLVSLTEEGTFLVQPVKVKQNSPWQPLGLLVNIVKYDNQYLKAHSSVTTFFLFC